MQEIEEQQVHILIGCADARDLNQLQVEAVNTISTAYKEKGIHIEFHVIRAAGSFVTPDVIEDIKRTFETNQRNSNYINKKISYYVHINSHGELDESSDKSYVSHIHNMKIVEGSPFNCGMLGASGVGIELEKLIVEEKPVIKRKGEEVTIDTDSKIRILLRELYAYDGYLAGDWVKSIDYLRTHPRAQRAILEKAIMSDPNLKTLDIKVTAGIQDYAIHALIRVDGGHPAVPFWDDVQAYIRNNRTKESLHDILLHQSEKQKPLAGLLCMADPRMSSRLLAAQYYMKYKGVENTNTYMPNTVFNLTGSSFDMPLTPFGPYVIAGFYYSVKHLELTDQMVMGYNEAQTNRIMQKIKNDLLMSMIIKKYNVNLIPINQLSLAKS